MKPYLFLLFFCSQVACNKKLALTGSYFNIKYMMDAPINVLSLEQGKTFSLTYPSVIGEKQLGEWELKNDTLILHVKTELKNNFQDTIIKNDNSIYKYLVKYKSLHSMSNDWVLKKQ